MNTWIVKFSETSLLDKKDFYSCINMENITDSIREYLKNLK